MMMRRPDNHNNDDNINYVMDGSDDSSTGNMVMPMSRMMMKSEDER